MNLATLPLLSYRCRRARGAVREACASPACPDNFGDSIGGWCEHCKRTERGSQVRLAGLLGVQTAELSRFIRGRDIGGGFLRRVESWMAGETVEEETV